MQREQLQSALGKAGLQNISADVEKLFLPSIRIKTRPAGENRLAVGVSRVGGMPDLPPQVEWPMWKGKPQSFIAQIDLAQASQYDEQKVLPKSGTLYFFYDEDQQTYGDAPADRGGWKVIYDAEDTTLARRSAPDSLKMRFKPSVAEFSTEFTLPQDVSLYDLHWTKDEF